MGKCKDISVFSYLVNIMSNKVCLFAGLRHISVLKLLGTEMVDMGGVLELYPINGKDFFFNRKCTIIKKLPKCVDLTQSYKSIVYYV